MNWAIFMGGGSLVNLPDIHDKTFFESAAEMKPLSMNNADSLQYVLGKKGTGYIIFCESEKVHIDLTADKNSYHLKWINPVTGEIIRSKKILSGKISEIEAPFKGAAVAWLIKNN